MSQKPWICSWEKLCIVLGFVLLHDGQRNPGQFKFPPGEVRFYTKVYQGMMDGKPISSYVKFKYDLREGEVGMEITWRDPRRKIEREEMVLRNAKEVINGKHIG